jgi:hypothetical protein
MTSYPELPLEPPQKRRWPWVLGFVLGFLLLIVGAAGYGIYRLSQMPGVEIQETDHGFIITKDGKRIVTIGLSTDDGDTSQRGDVITRTVPLAAGGTFALTAEIGDVQISTWDQEVVSITAKKHLGSIRAKEELDFEVDTSTPNTVMVRTKPPTESRRAHLDYEIKLPRQVNIDQINTGTGDIKIEGVQGRITVGTVNGDVELHNVEGALNAKTVNGDVDVEMGQGADAEDMNFESVNGDISLRFLDQFNADLSINTVRGDISANGDLQIAVERSPGNRAAQGRVGRGGGPRIHIQTVNGDIKLNH